MRKTVGMLALAGALAMMGVATAHAACDPGDRIDRTTAADARKKIEGDGYKKVHDLKKSCDNFWHGLAEKDGAEVRVAVSPQGQVYREGD